MNRFNKLQSGGFFKIAEIGINYIHQDIYKSCAGLGRKLPVLGRKEKDYYHCCKRQRPEDDAKSQSGFGNIHFKASYQLNYSRQASALASRCPMGMEGIALAAGAYI